MVHVTSLLCIMFIARLRIDTYFTIEPRPTTYIRLQKTRVLCLERHGHQSFGVIYHTSVDKSFRTFSSPFGQLMEIR